MKNVTLIIAALTLLGVTSASAATHFTMQDGSVITGDIQALKDGVYTIVTPYGTMNVPAASIKSIDAAAPHDPVRSTPAASNGPLRLAGSTTIGDELMPALLESYAASKGADDPEWTVEGDPSEQMLNAKGKNGATFAAHLSRHGSATAFTALLANNADLGMASRPVNKDEIQKLQATSFGLPTAPGQENVLALDGLVILVHKNNPISRLSLDQIGSIFSGAVTDWKQVGGNPGPIHIYARDSKSGTADTFNGIVLKGKKLVASAELEDGNDVLADKVAADVGGVGYAGFAYVRGAKALNIVTDCGLTFPRAISSCGRKNIRSPVGCSFTRRLSRQIRNLTIFWNMCSGRRARILPVRRASSILSHNFRPISMAPIGWRSLCRISARTATRVSMIFVRCKRSPNSRRFRSG